jgi:hypothetical protein
MPKSHTFLLVPFVLSLSATQSFAQATVPDYQRAMELREKYEGLVIHSADTPRWIEQTNRFYYRRTVKGGHEWILVDGATREKRPAFDHEKLAAAVAKATSREATAVDLPFTAFTFVDDGRAIQFTLGGGPGGRGGAAGNHDPRDGPHVWSGAVGVRARIRAVFRQRRCRPV